MRSELLNKTILNPQSSILNVFTLVLGALLLSFQIFSPVLVYGAQSPVVRLLLDEKQARVVISGSSLEVEEKNNGRFSTVIRRIRMAAFSAGPNGVQLEGSDTVARTFRVRALKGMLRYEGRPYRGYLTVISSGGRLMVVAHSALESYLVGVVNGEIDSSWPQDAVMAQVVAARSYALYQVNEGSPYYDLKTDVTNQVYAGVHSEDERAKAAVSATQGQVLYRKGKPVQAFFHSSCGGSTSSATEVWGVGQPEQKSVHCGECDDAPYARWNLALDAAELIDAVKALYPRVNSIRAMGIHRRSDDGRVQTLFVETGKGRVLIDAGEFRKEMGYRRLPSTRFSLGKAGSRIVLTGQGYGHGVGLCQWGARGSALRGMDYRQILSKYYPGTEIRRVY